MRSRSASKNTNIVQEADILSAPMEVAHKNLVLRHFHRLRQILDEPDEEAIGQYTNKQAAREQLARMTLVFRQYEAMWRKGEIDDTVESMVADVIDASFAVDGRRGTYDQPVFSCPLLMGREQEIAALMQDLEAECVDDMLELWNAPPRKAENVLPDYTIVDNIAADIDWTSNLVRSKSENNLAKCCGPKVVIKDRPKFTRNLSTKDAGRLNYTWPPKSTEKRSFVGLQCTQTNASDWEEWLLGIGIP